EPLVVRVEREEVAYVGRAIGARHLELHARSRRSLAEECVQLWAGAAIEERLDGGAALEAFEQPARGPVGGLDATRSERDDRNAVIVRQKRRSPAVELVTSRH